MKKQGGMATLLMMFALLVGVLVLGYFWWNEREQRVALVADMGRLESSLNARRSEFKQKQADLSQQEADNFRLNRELGKAKRKFADNQKELNRLIAFEHNSKSKFEALNKQIIDGKNALASVKQTLQYKKEELEQANTGLEQQISQLKETMEGDTTAFQKDKEALNTEKESLASVNTALETEIAELNSALEQSRTLGVQHQSYLEDMKQQMDAAKQEFENEIAVLEQKNKSLFNEKSKIATEKEELAKVKAQLEQQVGQLNKALNDSKISKGRQGDTADLQQPASDAQHSSDNETKIPSVL